MARYQPDPARISLEELFGLFQSAERSAGTSPAPNGGADRLKQLKASGIGNLEDLFRSFQTPEALNELAQRSGIPTGYLKALRNQAERCYPEPCSLSRFPGIPFEYTEVLISRGIKNTRDLFESASSPSDRNELALRTGIPRKRVKELWELCDLARIPGMGGIPARVAWEAGIRSVELYASAEADEQYDAFLKIIKKRAYSTVDISLADIEFAIRYARMVTTHDPDNEGNP